MSEIAIDLKAKGDTLAMQNATDRLKALRAEIDKIRGKGEINLTVGDARNISRLTRDAQALEGQLNKLTVAGTKSATGIKGAFEKLTGGTVSASGALKTLGLVAGPAMFIGLAKGAVNTVVALDAMREESEQISARFVAQAGSTRNAAEALSAMNAVVGQALTNDEKMAASGQLMALGLAQSSTEAANLTNIAINLGDKTQGAAQRIAGLTQVMVSGRLVGLKNYGISMQDVNTLAAQMQRETAGLSDIQAKQNAIMAIGTQKLNEYTAAGGTAVTQTQNLTNAWSDYLDAQANSVNVGNVKGAATDVLQGATIRIQIASPEALDQLAGLEARLRELQNVRNDFTQNPIFRTFFGTGPSAAEEIIRITAKIQELKGELAEESRWAAGMDRLAGGAQNADAATEGLNAELQALRDNDEAIRAKAALMAIYTAQTNNATASTLALGAAMYNLPRSGFVTPNVPDPRAAQGYGAYDAGRKAGANLRDAQVAAADIARANEAALKKMNTATASDYQKQMDQAGQRVSSRVQGYMSSAMQTASGLFKLPGTEISTEAGANGPFENIFRTLDVAKLGAASPWAEKLGLTQEQAAKIGADFQAGIFSPEVVGLIDVNALVNQAKMAELATASQKAFADAIAAKAGTGPNIVTAMLGLETKKEGEKGGGSTSAAEKAMGELANSIGEQVTGKDFAGKMIGYGEMIWGYTEEGMINKAKGSTAFQSAINAMVSAAIAGALQ